MANMIICTYVVIQKQLSMTKFKITFNTQVKIIAHDITSTYVFMKKSFSVIPIRQVPMANMKINTPKKT